MKRIGKIMFIGSFTYKTNNMLSNCSVCLFGCLIFLSQKNIECVSCSCSHFVCDSFTGL